jgi:hypothetical protein
MRGERIEKGLLPFFKKILNISDLFIIFKNLVFTYPRMHQKHNKNYNIPQHSIHETITKLINN